MKKLPLSVFYVLYLNRYNGLIVSQASQFSQNFAVVGCAHRAPKIAATKRFYLHQNLLLFSIGSLLGFYSGMVMVRDAHPTKVNDKALKETVR